MNAVLGIQTDRPRIDWEALDALERATSLRLSAGEARQLSVHQIRVINRGLHTALKELEPMFDFFSVAREQFGSEMIASGLR